MFALAHLALGCSSESDPGTGSADAGDTSDGGPGSDGATGGGDAASGAGEKIIFVTSTTHSGGLDGLAGGDAVCAARASEAGLGGTFKAWLSAPGEAAADRMSQGAGPYLRTDGTEVAASLDDLIDGSIEAPIDHDESGDALSGDVWTGTLSDGSLSDVHCDGFTDGSFGGNGQCGRATASDAGWTENITPLCGTGLHLYCVEQ